MVDNSKKKYFRGIFAQRHGSCAQASAIAYVFGYEINRLRNANAQHMENRYPTHWTYNFVNKGYDRGSWMMWGWEVGKSLGVPNAKVYGTETGYDLQYWPSDYVVYENAIDNRVEKYFLMTAGTESGLSSVKKFLWDHGANGKDGGILSFAAGWSTGYSEATIPEGQYGAGKKLIKSFGKSVNHAVTFVGYDDKICYDFNGDGTCSNDKDTNGDGKVNLKDWEIGAYIMANSWGTGWGNKGFIYVPYRLAALNPADGGIYMQIVYGVVPRVDTKKRLVLKVEMQHSKRNELNILSSYSRASQDRNTYFPYYGLQRSGGSYPLNGKDDTPVTFGLDLMDLLAKENMNDPLELSSVVDSLGGGVGRVVKMAVVDYDQEMIFESDDENVDIAKGRTEVAALWDPDGEPDPEPDPPAACQVDPIASAGDNLTVGEYCTVTLDAEDSYDLDGEIVGYSWKQIYGKPKLRIDNADTKEALVFTPLVKNTTRFYFQLRVEDNHGHYAYDTVRVTVMDRFDEEENSD